MSDLQRAAKNAVVVYFNEKNNQHTLTEDEVHLTWYADILPDWRAMAYTDVPDGMYYELIYNGKTNELNVAAYKKFDNMIMSPKQD